MEFQGYTDYSIKSSCCDAPTIWGLQCPYDMQETAFCKKCRKRDKLAELRKAGVEIPE